MKSRIRMERGWAGLWMILTMTAGAYDNGDWQVWNTDSAEHRLDERWKLKVETEFYFGDGAGDFYYAHADAGLACRVASWFEAGLYHRYIQEKKDSGWLEENRPHLNGIFQGTLGPVNWTDRNRFEFRAREDVADGWRYRNRFRVQSARRFTSREWQPYADIETFYDLRTDEWNQNRTSLGLTLKATSSLRLGLYGMLQVARKSGEWANTNIIGLDTKWTF